MVVWQALGLNLADLAIRSAVLHTDEGDVGSVVAIASLLVGGVRTDVEWSIGHRNSDFVSVSEVGEIPVLTPAEALIVAGREVTQAAVDEAELTLETRFDRESGERLLIPVYSVPVSDDLDVGVTIAATREQDIPASSK